MKVDQGIAYVVGPNGLDIVDVSDPTEPSAISAIAHVGSNVTYRDVMIIYDAGRTIALLAGGLTDIVDVTDPSSPVVLGDFGYYAHRFYLRSTPTSRLLYLPGLDAKVRVFDVTDIDDPQQLGVVNVPGSSLPGDLNVVSDVSGDDNSIYVSFPPVGLVALDVTAGFDMATVVASVDMYRSFSHWSGMLQGRPVLLHGEAGPIGLPKGMAYLRVIDADPLSQSYLTDIGQYQSRREVGIAVHRPAVVGTRAYVPYQQDGLRVLDLSRPEEPQEIGYYDSWGYNDAPGYVMEGAMDVDVADGLIYLADSERGLLILRDVP